MTGPSKRKGWRRAWAIACRVGPWVLAAVVLGLVAQQAVTLDWAAVRQALAGLSPVTLMVATALALLAHGLFSAGELVGRRVVGHRASVLRTLAIAAVSYACNLNLGAMIGALAVRLRLYDRAGVSVGRAGQIVALGMIANWTAWAGVAAVVLMLADPMPWPQAWPLPAPSSAVQWVLAALLALVPTALMVACAWPGARVWHVRGHALARPSAAAAATWMALTAATWVLVGVMLWLLIGRQAPLVQVLGAVLLAAIAGTVIRVPAGLGVLEATVVASLGSAVPTPVLVAGLLALRALHYGLPLLGAAAGYLWLEGLASRRPAADTSSQKSRDLRDAVA